MNKRKNILWLDDDLRPKSEGLTEERSRLQPWLRWFATGDRPQHFALIEAQTVEKFATELQQRTQLKPTDHDYVHALLIDAMWKHTSNSASNFGALGFKNEAIIPMEAGIQLIGLLRNARYKSQRPDWLEPYANRDAAILTSLTDSHGSLQEYVDAKEQNSLTVMQKQVVTKTVGDTTLTEPADNWLVWITKIRQASGK